MREPSFSFVGGLGVWEFAGTSGATVVLCHATGFHGRCWDQVVARLPDDWRVLALDMRGHGRSPASGARPVLWKDFGRDVALIAQELGLRDAIGVGHSMGGHSVACAAALRPETFARLLLIDPVIRPAVAYGKPWVENHFARKRRNVWTSSEEMLERFRGRAPFDTWDPEVLRDYCAHALRDGAALACDPDFEASIYENSSVAASDLSAELALIGAPVVVMRSRVELSAGVVDMNASPCDPMLAGRLLDAVDRKVPHGHFIPMEAPGLVADAVIGRG